MNDQQAIEQLKKWQMCGHFRGYFDTERAHSEVDDVLCELLTSLGYADVVEKYHKVDKWFA